MNPHVVRGMITHTVTKDGVEVSFEKFADDRTDTTFPKVVETLGGREAFDQLPTLDIGDKMGRTGYLDFIRPEDMSAPIMKGVDSAGRPFVALRYSITEEVELSEKRYLHLLEDSESKYAQYSRVEGLGSVQGTKDKVLVKLVEEKVEVIFRRYTTGSTWTSGGASDFVTSKLTDEGLERIGRLVRGELVGVSAGRSVYDEEDLEEALEDVSRFHRVSVEEDVIEWSGKTMWYVCAERGSISLI